jgi:hypothetical protein
MKRAMMSIRGTIRDFEKARLICDAMENIPSFMAFNFKGFNDYYFLSDARDCKCLPEVISYLIISANQVKASRG